MTWLDGVLHATSLGLHALLAGKVPAEEPGDSPPGFGRAVISTLASIGRAGKTAAVKISGAIWWYVSYLIVLTVAVLAINLIYATFMLNWASPGSRATVVLHMFVACANIILVAYTLPLIAIFSKLKRSFATVAAALFALQEAFLLGVTSTLAIALFASVNPRVAFWMLVAWVPSLFQMWNRGESLAGRVVIWSTRLATISFLVLSALRIVAFLPEELAKPFGKLATRITHTAQESINALAAEQLPLLTEEQVADMEKAFDDEGNPLVFCSEIRLPDNAMIERCFQTRFGGMDPRYPVRLQPLTLHKKIEVEVRVRDRRQAEKEAAEREEQQEEERKAREQEAHNAPPEEPPVTILPPVVAATMPPTLPTPLPTPRPTPRPTATPEPLTPAPEATAQTPIEPEYDNFNSVVLATGTAIKVKVDKSPVTDDVQSQPRNFTGIVAHNVVFAGDVVIGKGTPVEGKVWLEGNKVVLQLRYAMIGERDYSLDTESTSPRSSLGRRILRAAGGAVIGAALGAAVDGKDGAKKGAVIGGAAGTVISFTTDKPITFKLRSPARLPLQPSNIVRW